jgi:hypothetical protein
VIYIARQATDSLADCDAPGGHAMRVIRRRAVYGLRPEPVRFPRDVPGCYPHRLATAWSAR